MATPRPKYVAVVHFSAAGQHFEPGDPVPPGLALDAALMHGDQFVNRSTKPTPAAPPALPEETDS